MCPRAEWLRAVLDVVIVRAYSGEGVGFTEDTALTLIEVLIARKCWEQYKQ